MAQLSFNVPFGYNVINLFGTGKGVYCIKIRMKDLFFIPDIPELKVETKGRVTMFTHVTLQPSEHERIGKLVGLFLEDQAQRKLQAKYAWAHPYEPNAIPQAVTDLLDDLPL